METGLFFKTWKSRCSSLGHIMTNLPAPFTENHLTDLKNLIKEKRQGINANGNKVKWSDVKEEKLYKLFALRKAKDELPEGAKTHLDDVFRSHFWGRKRMLNNRYLEKGNLCEDDAIGLLSEIDNTIYFKNERHFENDYLHGTPDIISPLHDTKSNYDLDSHDKAELTQLYKYQIKGYCSLLGIKFGTVDYALVNSPIHHIQNERTRLFYAMGNPSDDDENWKECLRQLEKNHIFDIPAFQKAYPHYVFENEILDFSIPAIFRIKKFDVDFTPEDEENIPRRVIMSRIYLCEKERKVRDELEKHGLPQINLKQT